MRTHFLVATLVTLLPKLLLSQCGANPTSGVTTIAAVSQIINSYYPGLGNPATGQTSLAVGAIDSRGNTTTLSAGDLVLVIQMQGAAITTTNTDAYGDGVSGGAASGALTTSLYAGYYEYNTVNSVVGSTINFTYSLANNYYTQAFAPAASIRTYQVIRVPRYYDLTINAGASVVCPAWNGSTGGVAVLDAVNLLTLNGTVNVTGLGFRGGGGKNFTGAGGGSTNGTGTLANTDYRWDSPVTTPANTTGGVKGEGIAGTPAYTLATGATATQTEMAEGYIGGSEGRSAPANAGGGATDGIPVGSNNNQYNTGGGGGANAGDGGNGGSGWHGGSGTVATYPYGGYGGAAFTKASLQRLVMGGGGGAGTANNSTAANEYQSSGGCGGGIIITRAKTYSGNGSLLADGADAPGVVGVGGTGNTDAAGGGGGGGTIVVVTRTAGAPGLGSVTASVKGGKGGDMTNYYDHGPGGGGGGGFVYTNGSLSSVTMNGGVNGKTRTGSTGGAVTNDFGATGGTSGQLVTLSGVPLLVNTNNIASPCGVLPVSLLNFTGMVKNNEVLVQWMISNAIQIHHFEVEYSTDSRQFSTAGKVAYTTGIISYEFLHQWNNATIVYYRLKLVDENGGYTYSKTIPVKINRNSASAVVFPNPTAGSAGMQLAWDMTTPATLQIIDAAGKIVGQKNVVLQQGDNSISLPGEMLADGIYIIRVKAADKIIASERLQVSKK